MVSADDFCPRSALQKRLADHILAGQSVVLQGERRIGKTSLICETVRRLKHRRMLYVDLLEIKTVDDLGKRMAKALISLEQQAGLLERALKTLANLRPAVSLDPLTGQPSITMDATVRLKPASLEGLLDLVYGMHKRMPLVVVFDEFQDVLNLSDSREALAVMRGKTQFQKKLPYIFAGSVRSQMGALFNDSDSPFFKAAVAMEVGPLEPDVFMQFLAGKFALGKRTIAQNVLPRVLALADNVPGDVQELCGALWETTSYKSAISEVALGPALELIYARESKGYEAVLVHLTGPQVRCLVGLARMGGKAPQSAAFVQGSGFTMPASVKKALDRLVQLRVIYRHQAEYKFVNPFFKAWLLWKGF